MDIDDMWDDEEDIAQFCKPKRNIPSGIIAQEFHTHPDFGRTEYVRADLHDATRAQLAKAVEALKSLIQHAYNCEKELTEELHHMDFCGESLLLINARAVMAEIEKGGV